MIDQIINEKNKIMKAYILLISIILTGYGAFAQYNTFTGTYSGASNTTGYGNTFKGYSSGRMNTTGILNTFNGYESGYNSNGRWNVFIGYQSGYNNQGDNNVFAGYLSGKDNTSGSKNTFIGSYSGMNNTTGTLNTFFGYASGYKNTTGSFNTCIGWGNYTTGNHNILLGYAAAFSENYNNSIAIGYSASCTGSNQVRIGNTNTNNIGGIVGWSVLSDGRFKKNVKDNVAGLDFIMELQPVNYEIDEKALRKFRGIDTLDIRVNPITTSGFVAQDVEKLVKEKKYEFHGVEAPQNETDNYTIQYSEFVVPLVKAVQEMNAIVESQEKEISELLSVLSNGSKDVSGISGIQLFQNNLTPATSSTSIEMYLPEDISRAEIQIINMDGRILKTVSVNERGNTSITIEEGTLNSGVYNYALVVDGNIAQSKRLILTE